MKYILMFLAIACFSVQAWAMNSISGGTFDADTRKPLPFTHIVILGKYRGSVSNIDGRYRINLTDLAATDSVRFSYMGYQSTTRSVAELRQDPDIYLKPTSVRLSEVLVPSRQLTAKQIVKLVEDSFPANHPQLQGKHRIFFHEFEQTPFSSENRIDVMKSSFESLSKEKINELLRLMPQEFIDYRDALVDWYAQAEHTRLVPLEGVELESGSAHALGQQVQAKISDIIAEVKASKDNEEEYFQVSSGIIRHKFKSKNDDDDDDNPNETTTDTDKLDSTTVWVNTNWTKKKINKLIADYAHIDSDNWEFISKQKRYVYTLNKLTVFNKELVYEIAFSPKRRGKFEGTMYISANSFAVLQLEFGFAEGESAEKFKLLGLGHKVTQRKASVIFEKYGKAYAIKYIHAQQKEANLFSRKVKISKRKKRFLVDKTLSSIKLDVDIEMNVVSNWELLVLNREAIQPETFKRIVQPKGFRYQKELVYDSNMWKQGSVIMPSKELQQLKNKSAKNTEE